MADQNTTAKCPACGFENPARKKYCGQCGQPLIGKAKPSPGKSLGEMIEIVGEETPVTPPLDELIEVVEEKPPEIVESPTKEQAPSVLTCRICGMDNRPEAIYCGLCGAVVAPHGAPCPDCGTTNMPGDLFCSKCTRRLGVEWEEA